MTYIKQSHRVILHDAASIIDRRKDTLNSIEKIQYKAFCGFLDDIEKENKIIANRTKEKMREYRSNPSTAEKRKQETREAVRRYRERQKANKK